MIGFAAARRLAPALLISGVLAAGATTGSATHNLGDGPEIPPCPGCVDTCDPLCFGAAPGVVVLTGPARRTAPNPGTPTSA